MKSLFVIINAVLVVLFTLVQYLKFSPKAKARLGIILALLLAAYLFLIVSISLHAIWMRDFSALPLAVFLFIPFFIGKKVNYETLSLWSNVQLLAFMGSLTYCLVIAF